MPRWTHVPSEHPDAHPVDRTVLRDGERVAGVAFRDGTWLWASWVYPSEKGSAGTLDETLVAARIAVGDKRRI